MPEQVIVEYLVKDSSSETLNRIAEQHKRVGEKTEENTRALGGLRDMTQGFGAGLMVSQSILSQFSQTEDRATAATDMMRTAMQAAALAMFNPTPLGLLASGLGIVVSLLDAQQKAYEKTLQPSKDLIKSIDDLGKAHSPLAQQIQDVIGLSAQEADAWAKAATQSDAVARSIREQAKARQDAAAQQGTVWKPTGTADPRDFGITEMSDAMARFSREADAARWAGLGEQYKKAGISKSVELINEQKRVLDLLAPNILKAKDAWDTYGKTMQDLAASHRKTLDDLKAQSVQAQADAGDARIKVAAETAKRLSTIERDLHRTLGEQAYQYAQSLANLMYQRYSQDRELTSNLAQAARERTRALQSVDEELGDRVRAAHTDREREKAELAAIVQRRAIEEQNADRLRQLAEQKAQRDEDFARQKALLDEQTRHQRAAALEAAEIQKQAARDAAQSQVEAIEQALTKQLAAIDKRKTEEDRSYTDAQLKAKQTRDQQIVLLADTRTEQEKLNAAVKVLGTLTDANTLKLLEQYRVLKLMGQTGAPSEAPPTNLPPERGYAGGTGGWQTVPGGFNNDSFRIGLSSGEKFNVIAPGQPIRSGGVQIGTLNLYGIQNAQQLLAELEALQAREEVR